MAHTQKKMKPILTQFMPITSDQLNQIAPRPRKSGLYTKKIESKLGIIPQSVETCLNEIRKQFIK